MNAVFPVCGSFAAQRHPLTGGVVLTCGAQDVLSPIDGRVVSCGVARRLGHYAVVYSATYQKFFRLMLMTGHVVEQGQYVRPGHALGFTKKRLYYDVMLPGPQATYLPDGDAPGVFAPVRAYHPIAALKGL